MKMEAVGKAEELVDSEVPPKTSEKQETAPDEGGPIELETQTQKDKVPTAADSVVLSSMPCLLMELRRDSSESQLTSTESDKPMGGRVYESDSSNNCMLSPSSSGHLADSDTLSSTEENEPCQAEAAVEGDPSAVSGAAVGRKSRRSRSESETSTMAAKKNRQSSDKQKGIPESSSDVGHCRKRERELTFRSLSLYTEHEADGMEYPRWRGAPALGSSSWLSSGPAPADLCPSYVGGSRAGCSTPGGPPVVAHYDISDTNSDPEVVNVDNLLAAAVVQEHNNSLGNQDSGSTWRTGRLLDELSANTGHLDPGFLASDKTSPGNAQINEEINIASSDSEVEIVGVQKHARCVHPRGGVIQSVSSWKHGSGSRYINTQRAQSWTAVTPQQNWSSPPEVVDLTLDEDTRRKYLL
ncbi:Uncharacterized protein C18orf25 [Charadrius vociferus]|uniref:Uncharacterized protein C18orf25 n=1 Tax=Charadrius vociferus TaxID=50402 RepID=A0A0A0ATA5_CHAVO|nr:Uncharacterized protein C18orf25 [Charadrius vociferus]